MPYSPLWDSEDPKDQGDDSRLRYTRLVVRWSLRKTYLQMRNLGQFIDKVLGR